MERKWFRKLSVRERIKFDILSTDTDRDAFRILRNWSQTDSPDFKVRRNSLAERLCVVPNTAGSIRIRFCSIGIMRQTAEYVPRQLCARYEWTANNP